MIIEIFNVEIVFNHIMLKINLISTKNYCHVDMPQEDNEILKYNHRKNLLEDHLLFMLT